MFVVVLYPFCKQGKECTKFKITQIKWVRNCRIKERTELSLIHTRLLPQLPLRCFQPGRKPGAEFRSYVISISLQRIIKLKTIIMLQQQPKDSRRCHRIITPVKKTIHQKVEIKYKVIINFQENQILIRKHFPKTS